METTASLRIPYPSAIFPDFEYLTDPMALMRYQETDAHLRGVALNQVSMLVTEANILRAWTADNGVSVPSGRIEFHLIRYCALLFSYKTRGGNRRFVPEPWFQENVWCLMDSIKSDRAGACFFGNQNQGKTMFFCLMAVALGCLHPHSTNQVLMAPVKADRTAGVWTEFLELAKETKRFCRAKMEALGADISPVESSGIVYFSAERPGGFTRLQAAAECATIQGRKEKEDGFLIHYLDEIGNDYPNGGAAWLATLPNIAGNNRYFCILAANPRNQIGGLDSEMEPVEGWASQTEHDYFWKAGQHNINVYRRAGHQSPNFRPEVGGTLIDDAVAQTDRDKRRGLHGPYPWLYNGRREQKLLSTVNGNRNDPRYKEQAMGMMPAMSLTLRVITTGDVEGSGMDLPFLWIAGPGDDRPKIQRVAFLDPAKTAGGDRNVLTLLEAGHREEDHKPFSTVFIREQMELVPTGTRKVDLQWLMDCERIRRRNNGNGEFDAPVPFVRELAMIAAAQCLEWNVPFANFGFDDTLSGEVTSAMKWAFGHSCVSLSFGGQASKRPILPRKFLGEGAERRQMVYNDLHKKHVTELYSRLAHWMRGGYLRMNQAGEGNKPDRWIKETIMRSCKRHGDVGWDVESKQEYKARKNQISPDFADSLIGALHMIEIKGMIRVEVEIGEGDNDYPRLRRALHFIRDLTMKPQRIPA